MAIDAGEYRRGSLERLDEARTLLVKKHWTGAAYLAGRAAEGMLCALLRSRTKEHESGHDLRNLLRQTGHVGLLHRRDEDRLYEDVNTIAGAWFNDLRFLDQLGYLKRLKGAKMDRGVRGDAVEYWAKRLVESSEAVVSRGDVIWSRSKTN
jgi:HEPN domain-containing protein